MQITSQLTKFKRAMTHACIKLAANSTSAKCDCSRRISDVDVAVVQRTESKNNIVKIKQQQQQHFKEVKQSGADGGESGQGEGEKEEEIRAKGNGNVIGIGKENENEDERDNLDSGYAWLILIVMFLLASSTCGTNRVYGLIYAKQVAIGYYDHEQASWPIATASTIENLAGLMTPALAQFLTWRQIELLATVLFVMANLGAYFSNSLELDIFCLGIIQGLALSINTVLSLVINNDYFERYRTTAYGISLSGSTFGILYLGPLVSWCLEQNEQQFRIAYLAIASVLALNFMLVIFIKPRRDTIASSSCSSKHKKEDKQKEVKQQQSIVSRATATNERKISLLERHLERKNSVASIDLMCKQRRQSELQGKSNSASLSHRQSSRRPFAFIENNNNYLNDEDSDEDRRQLSQVYSSSKKRFEPTDPTPVIIFDSFFERSSMKMKKCASSNEFSQQKQQQLEDKQSPGQLHLNSVFSAPPSHQHQHLAQTRGGKHEVQAKSKTPLHHGPVANNIGEMNIISGDHYLNKSKISPSLSLSSWCRSSVSSFFHTNLNSSSGLARGLCNRSPSVVSAELGHSNNDNDSINRKVASSNIYPDYHQLKVDKSLAYASSAATETAGNETIQTTKGASLGPCLGVGGGEGEEAGRAGKIDDGDRKFDDESLSTELVKALARSPYLHCVWIMLSLYYLIARIFIIILVDLAKDNGLNSSESSSLLNYWSIGEIVGRIVLCSFVDLKWLSARMCIMLTCSLMSLPIASMALFNNFFSTVGIFYLYAICSGLIAALISLEYVLINVLMIEYLGQSRVTSCYSLGSLISSLALLGRPALIGLFRDKLGSYNGLLLLLAGLSLLYGLLFGLMEPLVVRYWPKRQLLHRSQLQAAAAAKH